MAIWTQEGNILGATATTINLDAIAGTLGQHKSACIRNDHASAIITGVLDGQSFTVRANEQRVLTGIPLNRELALTSDTNPTAYRFAMSSALESPWITNPDAFSLVAGSITTAMLQDGVLSADAAGRAKTAAGYFGLVAASYAHYVDDFWTVTQFQPGVGGKFAPGWLDTAAQVNAFPADSITNAVLLQAVVNGAFVADVATRALFAANFVGADASGRALMQAGFFAAADVTSIAHFADDFFDATMVSAAGAGGKFVPNAITGAGLTHLIADDAFGTAHFAPGVGGKFTAGALDNAGLVNLLADDVFTAAEFAAAGGGKFAANCLVTAGIQNLFADDSFTAAEFAAAGGGKFAANCLVTAGIQNLFADDSFTAAEFAPGVGGKFTTGCITNANVGFIADDAFSVTEVSLSGAGGKFLPNCITQPGVQHLFIDDAFTAAEFGAGVGGKFAANCLSQPNLANFVADDAFTVLEFAAGPGGKFAPNCLNTANIQNLFVDDAFGTAEFVPGPGGKFAAGCLDNTAIANIVADDAFTVVEVSTVAGGGKFAADCISAAGADHLFQAGAVGEDLLTATELTSRTSGAIAEQAGAAVSVRGAHLHVIAVDLPDAAAGTNVDVVLHATAGIIEVLDGWVEQVGAGNVGNTYEVRTGAAANILSGFIGNGAAGTFGRATLRTYANRVIPSGGTLRWAQVLKPGGVNSAKAYVICARG